MTTPYHGNAREIAGDQDTTLRDTLLTMWSDHGPDRAALIFGHWQAPPPTGERARLTQETGALF